MKTAISIPDPVFQKAARLARRTGMSRSELYSRAVERFVDEQDFRWVREVLDRVYQDEPSDLDPVLSRLQDAVLLKEKW